jgi:phage baseplate assembly protein W
MDSLALQYFGDASRWQEIADFNQLQYPYIVDDIKELDQFYARGYLTVERATTNNSAIVRKGWIFKTKPDFFLGGVIKLYEVTEDTTFPAGVLKADVPIQSVFYGTFGNTMEYMVTELDDSTKAQSTIQFTAVYNEAPITGGQDVNAKVTGDVIYIPVDSTEVKPDDISKLIQIIGGEDLTEAVMGVVFNDDGDLGTVSGTDNIKQAVSARLMTELWELSQHPEYGTELTEIIGTPNIFNKEKLAEIAILKALSYEDRIKDTIINTVTIDKDKIYIDLSYAISINGQNDRLQVTI